MVSVNQQRCLNESLFYLLFRDRFVIGVLLASAFGYTTAMLRNDVSEEQLKTQEIRSTTTPSRIVKKKNCGCCAERRARRQQQIRRAQERRQTQPDAVSEPVPNTDL